MNCELELKPDNRSRKQVGKRGARRGSAVAGGTQLPADNFRGSSALQPARMGAGIHVAGLRDGPRRWRDEGPRWDTGRTWRARVKDIVERRLLWAGSYSEKALALPQDTTAFEAMIAKASEVMGERCADACISFGESTDLVFGEEFAEEIRALPGVTLEDLK